MKIKNILYVASFMAFAGINVAELRPADAVVDIAVRTAPQVLQELSSLTMTNVLERGFFRRAGDHIRTAGVYAKHAVKYPVVVGALWLPLIMKSKNEIFDSSIGRSINWVIYGSLGAAAAIGLYHGPSEAREQLKTEAIVAEHHRTQTILNAAIARIADLENLHGVLERVHANVSLLTQQGQASRDVLTALQAQAEESEAHLNQLRTDSAAAQKKLAELQAAGAASTALAQVDNIQGSISRHVQLVQLLAQLMDSRTDSRVRVALVNTTQGMLKAAQECETVRIQILSGVQGNTAFLTSEQDGLLRKLRENLAPVLEGQRELQAQATQFLASMQMQIEEQEQVMRLQLQDQKRLALEAAATNPAPSVVVQRHPVSSPIELPRRQQQAQTQDMQLAMALQNHYGTGPARLLSLTPRPATPPANEALPTTRISKMEEVD